MRTISPNPEYNSTPQQVQRVLTAMSRLGLHGARAVVMNESGGAYSDDAYREVDLAKQPADLAQSFAIIYNWHLAQASKAYALTLRGLPTKRVNDLFALFGIPAAEPAHAIPAVAEAWNNYQAKVESEVFG